MKVDFKFTKIQNELIESISNQPLNGYELRILLIIFRKTYGYNKKEDYIALSQITDITGISKPHVSRTINNLIGYKIITKNGNKLSLNKNDEQWKVTKLGNSSKSLNLGINVTNLGKNNTSQKKLPKMVKAVTKLGNEKLPKTALQKKKDNITKDTQGVSEKNNTSSLPEKKKHTKPCMNSLASCDDYCLWDIAKTINTGLDNVKDKAKDIDDLLIDGSFQKKYKHDKTYHFTLIRWLKMSIKKGFYSYMSELEIEAHKWQHPDYLKKRQEMFNQRLQEGIL